MEGFSYHDADSNDEEISRQDHSAQQRRLSPSSGRYTVSPIAGPSTSGARSSSATSYDKIQAFEQDISWYHAEINQINKEILRMTEARDELQEMLTECNRDLEALKQTSRLEIAPNMMPRVNTLLGKGTRVDYTKDFDWTVAMKAKMKKIFGITEFRLCQAGVCNANMDKRDIVCVMPTGGGKSLTYQLPAIMAKGCTVVVSPLISLMTDQMMHLREFGIRAVMLSGSTTKNQFRQIYYQFRQMAGGSTDSSQEIKLCYVTPEKLKQSDSLNGELQNLADAGMLARIVIDEAHCISEQGHEFRPDYRSLNKCKTLWPQVPILAVTATCPPAVLQDVLKILKLSSVVSGQDAPSQGTVYFSSPLYRKNLHYKVLQKSSSGSQLIREITKYILQEHSGQSGIIYCLSKSDTENVARHIMEESQGNIRTGVYHAQVPEEQKHELHASWRNGDVNVVCATIAFGMGIDKGDVRFVIHHTLPKSLDGFYQESGRAGRDGKDADCILYYRPQDAVTLSKITVSEHTGQSRVHNMLRFAQEHQECRKINFAKYFNMSSKLDTASWSTNEMDAMSPCGHCDNCTRNPTSLIRQDVTVDAWKLLKLAEAIEKQNGRVTMSQMVDMARGNGKGEFSVVSRGLKGKGKVTAGSIDREPLIGEVVSLSKEQGEFLCVQLLLSGYLQESYTRNKHATNVYYKPGKHIYRITRRSLEDISRGEGARIFCSFLAKPPKASSKQKRVPSDSEAEDEEAPSPRRRTMAGQKRKATARIIYDDEDEGSAEEGHGDGDVIYIRDSASEPEHAEAGESTNSVTDGEDQDWGRTLRTRLRKRTKTHKNSISTRKEVIELSSD